MAIERVKRRLWGSAGFSLAEMMICMVILLIATAAVVNTLLFGMNQFETRTRESEAEVLSNTLSLELRNQLTCASSVKVKAEDGKTVTQFTSGADGADSVPCNITEEDGRLYITYYKSDGTTKLGSFDLVSGDDYIAKGSKPLAASHTLTWDAANKRFTVTLHVTDGGKVALDKSFVVSPVRQF